MPVLSHSPTRPFTETHHYLQKLWQAPLMPTQLPAPVPTGWAFPLLTVVQPPPESKEPAQSRLYQSVPSSPLLRDPTVCSGHSISWLLYMGRDVPHHGIPMGQHSAWHTGALFCIFTPSLVILLRFLLLLCKKTAQTRNLAVVLFFSHLLTTHHTSKSYSSCLQNETPVSLPLHLNLPHSAQATSPHLEDCFPFCPTWCSLHKTKNEFCRNGIVSFLSAALQWLSIVLQKQNKLLIWAYTASRTCSPSLPPHCTLSLWPCSNHTAALWLSKPTQLTLPLECHGASPLIPALSAPYHHSESGLKPPHQRDLF